MTGTRDAPRPGREVALAALFFMGATVLMTWPQALHLNDAMADLWDAKLCAWTLHWDYFQTLRDPLNLFQAPFFYPAKYVLAFSENLYGASLFGFPLLALGVSRVATYNIVLLLGMFLSALSAWALARYVTGDSLASVVAGLVVAFLPWRFAQIAHMHMQWAPFLCCMFLYLLRYLDSGTRRDQVLLAAFFACNGITSIHYAFFGGFLIAVTLSWEAVSGGPTRVRRILGSLWAVAAGSLICLPFAIPYKLASDLYGLRRPISEIARFSGRLSDFLSAGPRNKLYGTPTAPWSRGEGDFFPGLVPLVLAAAAVVQLRRVGSVRWSDRPRSRWRGGASRVLDVAIAVVGLAWLEAMAGPRLRIPSLDLGDRGGAVVVLTTLVIARLAFAFPVSSRFGSLSEYMRQRRLDRRAILMVVLAGTGVLIALGVHTPYYRFLVVSFDELLGAIRAPARGIVLFQIALGVLAAWGLSLLTRGRSDRGRMAWVALTVSLVVFEYRPFPLVLFSYEARPPEVYRWLKSVDLRHGAVIEWPLGVPHHLEAEYTFRQADHLKPLVNGYSGFFPPAYERLWELMERRPIPDDVWESMRELGANVLVWHAHPLEGELSNGGMAEVPDPGRYSRLVSRGIDTGKVELVASFPHGKSRDFMFRFAGARWETNLSPAAAETAKRELATFFGRAATGAGPGAGQEPFRYEAP